MQAIIKRFIPVMEMIQKLSPSKQTSYLKKAPKDFIQFLANVALNIKIGKFSVQPKVFAHLKINRKLLEKICEPKRSLISRRKLISRRGTYDKIYSPVINDLIQLISK